MPNGFETYSLYISLKSHFSSKRYDFHKYNGQIKAHYTAYEARPDRLYFEKIGKRYPKDKLIDIFVANFVERPDMWIGDVLDTEAEEIYTSWLQKIESLTYNFSEECGDMLAWLEKKGKKFNDIFKVEGHDHPLIVKMALQRVISLETFIILDMLLNFCPKVNKRLSDPVWELFFLKVTKYAPFLKVDVSKCRSILLKKIEVDHPNVK